MALALLALPGQSPEKAYLPFSPESPTGRIWDLRSDFQKETLNIDFIASWGDGDTSNNGCSVVARNGYVYLALGPGGLSVLDARNPEDSVVEVYNEDSVLVDALQLKDTLLVARTLSGGTRSYLDIFSLSNPTSPQLIGRVQLNAKTEDKFWASSYIYIYNNLAIRTSSSWGRVYIVDISDPTNPQKLSEWGPGGGYGIYQVAFYPPCYLYASSDAGDEYTDILYILDVSDPSNPYAIDSMVTDWGVGKALEVYDHYLYCGEKWVTVWDISDPLNPSFVYGALPLVQSADDYFINPQNKRLYLVDYLYVMGLSDPAYPIKVGAWSGDAYEVWLHSVYYDNGYIYCAGNQRYSGGDDLYILHYLYDTIPEDTGNPYLEWVQTIYGNPGLRFSLKQESQVSFALFNAAGQRAYQKDLGTLKPGPHTITLPGGLNPGVYVLFLKTNEQISNRKIVFTKGGD